METRTNSLSTKLQELIFKKSELIVDYLKSEAEKYKHIGFLFSNDEDTIRLFFPKCANKTINKIEEDLIKDKNFTSAIIQLFEEWIPVLIQTNIESIKLQINDFFSPIEKSNSWKIFWNKQVLAIENESEVKNIHDMIVGAFFYKAMMVWSTTVNEKSIKDEVALFKLKLDIFKQMAHYNTHDVMEHFTEKLRGEIRKKLAIVFFEITTLSTHALSLKINKCISDIKITPLYSVIPNNEALLNETLIECKNKINSVHKVLNNHTSENIINPFTNSTPNLNITSPRKVLHRKPTQDRKPITPLINLFENVNTSEKGHDIPKESLSSRPEKPEHESSESAGIQATIGKPIGNGEIQAFFTTPTPCNFFSITIKLNEAPTLQVSHTHHKKHSPRDKTLPLQSSYDSSSLFSKSKSRKTSSNANDSTAEGKAHLSQSVNDINKSKFGQST